MRGLFVLSRLIFYLMRNIILCCLILVKILQSLLRSFLKRLHSAQYPTNDIIQTNEEICYPITCPLYSRLLGK